MIDKALQSLMPDQRLKKQTKPKGAKRTRGRPRMYQSAGELQTAIDNYFEHVDNPGIADLTFKLGYRSKQVFYDLALVDEDFKEVIERARLRIETTYESDLRNRDVAPACTIFALKQYGWSDRQQVDINIAVDMDPNLLPGLPERIAAKEITAKILEEHILDDGQPRLQLERRPPPKPEDVEW